MAETRGGKLLQAYRNQAGLTRDELAERVGCSGPLITLIEGGQRSCRSIEMIRSLASACGKPADALWSAFAYDHAVHWINKRPDHISEELTNRVRQMVLDQEPVAA